jgi:GT2 family glycosyltransferase
MTCAIIIPSINFDKLLAKCVSKCLEQKYKKIKIYLILDNIPKIKIKNKKIIYLKCDGNISKKRNYGAKFSKENYLAFIDSDAYPNKKWIKTGIDFFLKNNFNGLLTGPDLAFPNEKGIEKIISFVNKSVFISGSKSYRKNTKAISKFVEQASSCNMMLKKSLFFKINGMDEDIYTGEDIAFCDKIKKNNFKIYFLNSFKIFHKTRSLKSFLIQRFVYGTSVFSSFKHSNVFKNLEFFIPAIIITIPLIVFIFFNEYIFKNLIIYVSLSLIILLESYKISKLKFSLIIYFLIILSTLLFGLGTLSKVFLSVKNIKKIYLKR